MVSYKQAWVPSHYLPQPFRPTLLFTQQVQENHVKFRSESRKVSETEERRTEDLLAVYKQFVQVSGLCGPLFLSYWPKRFTHLCRAFSWSFVWRRYIGGSFWSTNMAAGNQQKHLEFTFSLKALFFTWELEYVCINISSNTWNGYTAENQEERLFFNETAFLFWCHALWKLGSSNCCIFEMKHARGMKTCTKIYFLFIFNLV